MKSSIGDAWTGNKNLDQTGQHYMIDKKLIRFIVDEAMLGKEDVVLEIGPGHGELTKFLLKTSRVVAVDIEDSIEIKSKNLTFIKGNILDHISNIQFTKIVANIPYNISEPLMKKLFKTDFDLCIFTVGENFADLLTKKDNRIGILADHFYHIDVLKIVKPKSFSPQPRVDSAVVRIEPKTLDELSKSDILMRELLFLDDMKMKNAMERIFSAIPKRKVRDMTKDKIFNKKIYELSNEEFLILDNLIDSLTI